MLGTFVDPSRLRDAKKDARAVAFHATNAWDKVGTLKSIGLWDERVDVALRENTARHKLAHRQRVKAVAYVPEIDSQPQTFLQFDVKEDFVLAGFYGLSDGGKEKRSRNGGASTTVRIQMDSIFHRSEKMVGETVQVPQVHAPVLRRVENRPGVAQEFQRTRGTRGNGFIEEI